MQMSKKDVHSYIKKINIEEFSGHLGNSYLFKLHFLDKLIGNNHHPSIGTYKESLLMDVLEEYIPKRYSVGTGFALFAPITRFDLTSKDEYELSDQLDIIIYDDFNIPTIYQDKNFVILRPEAIKCVIEVKGSAHSSDIKGRVNSKGVKTKVGTIEKCQLYKKALKKYNDEVYKNYSNNTGYDKELRIRQPLKDLSVKYYLYCWDIYNNAIGTRSITNYIKNLGDEDFMIDGIYRYQDWLLYKGKDKNKLCYKEYSGQFKNTIGQDMDRTIWDLVHNVLFFLSETQENIAYDNIKIDKGYTKIHYVDK